MPVVTDYTALVSGSYWNGIEVTGTPVIVTYSFPTSAPAYDASIDGFTAATVSSFQAFTPSEQAQAIQALGEWSAASGLIFIQVEPGQGDITFQNVDFDTTSSPSYSGAGGIGFYPFGDWDFFSYPNFTDDLDAAGDIFMNTQFMVGGAVDYGTLLHEVGHAIGLKHPTEVVTDFAVDPDVVHDEVLSSDDPARTIMATTGSGGGATLLQLDKDAAAFIYGPAGTGGVYTTSGSGANAVSNWSWDATSQTLTQTAASIGATVRGSSVKDIINGSTGADRLFGLAGNDELNGGQGADSLFGGSGTDTLNGGLGDDSYYVSSSTATIVENSNEGFDFVYATDSFTLPDNVEGLSLFGIGLTGVGNDQGVSMFGDGTFSSTLIGGAGGDYMVGGAAADTLNGGGGIDAMFGGAGNDRYYVDNAGDGVTEAVGEGSDTVYASVGYALGAGSEVEFLRANAGATGLALTGNGFANSIYGGTGNDTLNGGVGNDSLNGGSGADTLNGGNDNDSLNGGGGIDVMSGGSGTDRFYVDSAGDVVTEAVGEGTDTVYASVGYALGAGSAVEFLRANAGATGLALTGNEFANSIYGGTGNDTLNGGVGNDTLNGGVGNDTLTGGSGADTLKGGNDNDSLNGSTGIDVMSGGAGTDKYYVDNAGDGVTEAVGEGSDTVYASVGYALGAGSEVEVLRANAGATGLTLTGNEFANSIYGGSGNDTLNGGVGNDVLSGGSGADTLNGGNDSDSLNGGTGIDVMSGGAGTDKYYVDNAGDAVTEALGEGTDTVYASVAYALGAGSEVEILRANAGATGLALTGNEFANSIYGGTGNDTLLGGVGNDTLTGGAGGDTFAYTASAQSTVGAFDRIVGFTHGLDLIDFTTIMGIASVQGLISGATQINANSIAWLVNGGNTEVLVNTTAASEVQAAAQMKIVLTGSSLGLDSGDFLHS